MTKYRIDADCSWTDNFGEIMCARTEKAFEAKDKEDAVKFAKEWIRENSNELINLHDAWITDCAKNELITNIG